MLFFGSGLIEIECDNPPYGASRQMCRFAYCVRFWRNATAVRRAAEHWARRRVLS